MIGHLAIGVVARVPRAGTSSAWETNIHKDLVSTSDVVVSAIHEVGAQQPQQGVT